MKVVGISDGDTFTGLNSDNLQLKFRIHGIDAPEKKQAYGTKAREHLGSLIFKQNVTVDVNDRDRWVLPGSKNTVKMGIGVQQNREQEYSKNGNKNTVISINIINQG
ncbi:MAG: thermonuclease family protein, partial [Prolixibacteraceae bacterium]|nr:thermonuclease family protein [Prolixibacteraceae bacterium]